MKRRILALLCLMLLCLPLLAGCKCKPYEEMWYVQSFERTEVFVNGVEHKIVHTGMPNVRDPFAGMKDAFVAIDFEEDGTMCFQPGTGELLRGTYTYESESSKETKILVTLENGESFTCTARSNSYGSSLTLTFRDNDYLFESVKQEPVKRYESALQDLTAALRQWSGENFGDIPVNPCTISREGEDWILTAENLNGPVKLDAQVAVRCFHMDLGNHLTQLSEITAGECHYAMMTYNGISFVTLYYIDG